MSSKIFVAATLLAAVANAGQLTIKNSCNFDTTLTTVHQADPAEDQPPISKNGGTYTQDLNSRGGEAWVAKISTPFSGNGNITQIEWSVTNNLYFDVSLINGDAFSGAGVTMKPSDSGCTKAICKPGVHCVDAYHNPTDPRTIGCHNSASDMTVELCAADSDSPYYAGSSSSTYPSSDSDSDSSDNSDNSSPSPVQAQAADSSPTMEKASDAPAVTMPATEHDHHYGVHIGNDGHAWIPVETVYWTTFVTKARRAAEPTAAVEKREAHEHGHMFAHNAAHQNHA